MKRPTDVLRRYLAQDTPIESGSFELGRTAMALEIMTIIRILEEYELIAEHEQMISVLQTLLRDQGLEDRATAWYEMLNEWRKPKFYDDVSGALDVQPSEHAIPREITPPHGSNDAPHGSDQSRDPS
jgi:predicted nucleic-acid-binding protein